MWKLYKLLNIIILFLLISCQHNTNFLQKIELVEFEDDNLCMMEGVEFKNIDTRKLYWECRLRIINQRIYNQNENYGYSLIYKTELKKLKKAIEKKIKEQNKILLSQIKNSIDETEHKYCISLKNEDNMPYFKCREQLSNKRKDNDIIFTNNKDFIKNNIKIKDVEITTDDIVISENCIKYASNKEKLNKCMDSVNNYNECIKTIDDKINKRKLDDKIYCSRSSINKYPDSLFDNKNQSEDMMIGPIMNKKDIINFRNKIYKECYKNRIIKMQEYKEYLENQCLIKNLKNI